MSKKIGIITNAKAVAKFYAGQLHQFFGQAVETYVYTFDGELDFGEREMDLYLISTSSTETFAYIRSAIPSPERIVLARITIPIDQINRLKEYPRGTRAYLVNLNYTMAIDTVSELYRLGVTNIELIPQYPGKQPADKSLRLAITPGETWYVPDFCDEVIDIGHRLLDSSTLIEVALKLDLVYMMERAQVQEYFHETEDPSTSVTRFFWDALEMQSRFEGLIRLMDAGIVGVDEGGKIFCFNKKAEALLHRDAHTVSGQSAADALPCLPFEECRESQLAIPYRLIKIEDQDISMSVTPILRKGRYLGAFALLRDFTEEERQQYKLRNQLMRKGHRARYTFENIIGHSAAISTARDIARRVARNNAAVLITGESGTGKELFAQAIHNASARREFPFVAINCAAIPHNLLESELFGYEEGAFTGARKGGHRGLFEYAHLGTLFLDEIEALPVDLQAKLLRVIQEKEIRRVGGDAVISVNVRLLSASNADIHEKLRQGDFRKDLYYRISTLPVHIPALRERTEDIPELIDYIQNSLDVDYAFSPAAMDLLCAHSWDGNVRELRNYVEYLGCLEKDYIEPGDLPPLLQAHPAPAAPPDITEPLRVLAGGRFDDYALVLRLLDEADRSGQPAGRKSLAAQTAAQGQPLSEQEIRLILTRLGELGAAAVRRGRGGSVITEKGRGIVEAL